MKYLTTYKIFESIKFSERKLKINRNKYEKSPMLITEDEKNNLSDIFLCLTDKSFLVDLDWWLDTTAGKVSRIEAPVVMYDQIKYYFTIAKSNFKSFNLSSIKEDIEFIIIHLQENFGYTNILLYESSTQIGVYLNVDDDIVISDLCIEFIKP